LKSTDFEVNYNKIKHKKLVKLLSFYAVCLREEEMKLLSHLPV